MYADFWDRNFNVTRVSDVMKVAVPKIRVHILLLKVVFLSQKFEKLFFFPQKFHFCLKNWNSYQKFHTCLKNLIFASKILVSKIRSKISILFQFIEKNCSWKTYFLKTSKLTFKDFLIFFWIWCRIFGKFVLRNVFVTCIGWRMVEVGMRPLFKVTRENSM